MSYTREVVRKDSKIRMLGDRAYFGDQEVIGNFKVYNKSEDLIFFVDPDNNLVNFYNTVGKLIFSFNTASGLVLYYDASGNEVYRFDPSNQRLDMKNTSEITVFRFDAANGRVLHFDGDGNEIYRFDTSTGKLQMKKADGTVIFEFDPATGDLTINGDPVNTSAEIFSHLSVEHFWTGSSSWVDRTGTYFKLNGDNFNNQSVYFESVMAVEQSGRTAFTRIWNITDGTYLANSVISTNKVGISDPDVVRSIALNLPSGEKEYKLQIKQEPAGGSGDNAHFYTARLVIIQK